MFDSFHWRQNKPPISKDQDEPRPQHYVFAHRLLPHLAQTSGLLVADLLGNEESATGFLLDQWQEAARLSGSPLAIAPDGLGSMVRRDGDWIIAVVGLPTPIATTEAFFVALAGRLPDESAYEVLKATTMRVLVLEKGWTMGGEARTVLGEWRDGIHLNYGNGSAPNPDAFYDLVVTVLGNAPPVLGSTTPTNVDE